MVEYIRYAVDNVDEYGRTPLMYATIKNKVWLWVLGVTSLYPLTIKENQPNSHFQICHFRSS